MVKDRSHKIGKARREAQDTNQRIDREAQRQFEEERIVHEAQQKSLAIRYITASRVAVDAQANFNLEFGFPAGEHLGMLELLDGVLEVLRRAP